MIVLKFGGTSLESAEAIERVARIVRSRMPRHPAVVVSAHGKATDNLLALAKDAAEGCHARSVETFNALEAYHCALGVSVVAEHDRKALASLLDTHFHELFNCVERMRGCGKLSAQAESEVTSFGERLSSGMMALALRKVGIDTAHLDARVLVRTNDRHADASPMLAVPVLGGFIGSTATGVPTTLGRNSSNLTAVLVAAAVDAEEVEIWTDVDGVYAHDPRLVTDQKPVETLSFEAAAEMAVHGAKVFHEGAVRLAQQENILIWIKNSRRPEVRGTRVAACEAITPRRKMNEFAPQAAAAESGIS